MCVRLALKGRVSFRRRQGAFPQEWDHSGFPFSLQEVGFRDHAGCSQQGILSACCK
jgi:hypothetical protein